MCRFAKQRKLFCCFAKQRKLFSIYVVLRNDTKLSLTACRKNEVEFLENPSSTLLAYSTVRNHLLALSLQVSFKGRSSGHLFFIFHMNDIVDKLFFVKISMYADGCVLYMSGNNWGSIRTKLQQDLDCFEHWGEINNLNLNVSKTRLLLVGTRSKLSRQVDIRPARLYNSDVPY